MVAEVGLRAAGWFPIGRGEILAAVRGLGGTWRDRLQPLSLLDRGRLLRVTGRTLTANLPPHVSARMAGRAGELLSAAAEWAREITKGSALALAQTKKLMRLAATSSFEDIFREEARVQEECGNSDFHQQARRAFFEKRGGGSESK